MGRRVARTGFFLSLLLMAFGLWQFKLNFSPAENRKAIQASRDIYRLSSSLAVWSKDNGGRYPAVDSVEKLQPFLVPAYADEIAVNDPWGRPYRFELIRDQKTGSVEPYIATAGRDGIWEEPRLDRYSQQVYMMESPDEDQVTRGQYSIRSAGCQCEGRQRFGINPALPWVILALGAAGLLAVSGVKWFASQE